MVLCARRAVYCCLQTFIGFSVRITLSSLASARCVMGIQDGAGEKGREGGGGGAKVERIIIFFFVCAFIFHALLALLL